MELQGLEGRDERSLHGISFDPKRKTWKARIHFAGKEHYIGRYNAALEAALAYDQAARMVNDYQDDGLTQPKPRRRPLNFPHQQYHDDELHTRLQMLLSINTPPPAAAAAAAAAGRGGGGGSRSSSEQEGASPSQTPSPPATRARAGAAAAAAAAGGQEGDAAQEGEPDQQQQQQLQQPPPYVAALAAAAAAAAAAASRFERSASPQQQQHSRHTPPFAGRALLPPTHYHPYHPQLLQHHPSPPPAPLTLPQQQHHHLHRPLSAPMLQPPEGRKRSAQAAWGLALQQQQHQQGSPKRPALGLHRSCSAPPIPASEAAPAGVASKTEISTHPMQWHTADTQAGRYAAAASAGGASSAAAAAAAAGASGRSYLPAGQEGGAGAEGAGAAGRLGAPSAGVLGEPPHLTRYGAVPSLEAWEATLQQQQQQQQGLVDMPPVCSGGYMGHPFMPKDVQQLAMPPHSRQHTPEQALYGAAASAGGGASAGLGVGSEAQMLPLGGSSFAGGLLPGVHQQQQQPHYMLPHQEGQHADKHHQHHQQQREQQYRQHQRHHGEQHHFQQQLQYQQHLVPQHPYEQHQQQQEHYELSHAWEQAMQQQQQQHLARLAEQQDLLTQQQQQHQQHLQPPSVTRPHRQVAARAPQPGQAGPRQRDVSPRQLDQDVGFVDSEEFEGLMDMVEFTGPPPGPTAQQGQQQQGQGLGQGQQQRDQRVRKSEPGVQPGSPASGGMAPPQAVARQGGPAASTQPHGSSSHPGAPAAAAAAAAGPVTPEGSGSQQQGSGQQQLQQQHSQESGAAVQSSGAGAGQQIGAMMPPPSHAPGTQLGTGPSQLQPPELLPITQCMPAGIAGPQQLQQGFDAPQAGAAAAAAAAAAGASGLLAGVSSRADLMRVTNSCLHKLLDMRLAALTVPEHSTTWEGLRAFLDSEHQQAQQQEAQAQQQQPGAGFWGAGAAGALQGQQSLTTAAVLGILGAFLQLLGQGLAGQGSLGPHAERLFVLGALNQLQQVLSALQRTTAAAAADPAADARVCLGQWVGAGLGLPPHSAINPVVSRLVEML